MVRWMRWHCPPDTGIEIRALAVWGRARYLSVTEAPHNTEFHTWMGKKHFLSLKPPRPGTEPRTLAWKAAVLTTTLGPPPWHLTVYCHKTRSLRCTGKLTFYAIFSIYSIRYYFVFKRPFSSYIVTIFSDPQSLPNKHETSTQFRFNAGPTY